MREISQDIVGKNTGKNTFTYTWRDVALYALGVGAKENELEYLYEKYIKAIPTYAVISVGGTFGLEPPRDMPAGILKEINIPLKDALHMTNDLIIHKPIVARGGKITFSDVITDVFDRGGKGAVIRSATEGYDEAGEKVFTNISDAVFMGYAAPGAQQMPKSDVEIPDREPDFKDKDSITAHQHLLYRLSGDTNLIHIDPEVARSVGLPKPILQGLCTYGYACRMAVRQLIPGEAERVTRFANQFRNMVIPGTEIELHLWKVADNKAVFRVIDLGTGQPALDRGVIEWK